MRTHRTAVDSPARTLDDRLITTSPVYRREVATASQIVSGGELRDRVAKVLAALRGAS